ncbi:exosortase A [Alteromonas sp. A081]|uniref:exosortase A n=1 Tax=Alteromonas sp. A081 TaxID=3410269 RepID=UPI003B983115
MSSKGVLTQTEIKKEIQLPPFKQNKGFYLSCLLVLCLWVIFSWQGLLTVVEIWYGNEIFNHGFFIVPGALYLIYLKRHELLAQPIYTTPLAFVVIIPAVLLYVVGVAGDIQLFMHAATYTLLPALIWLMIGTKAAKTILFPLVFMLFSVPVGEQLIPYLQEIAADGSVALLQLTGVPLYRSGLYIEIPQGRFLVAEACSGVSFFIASFVIGSLYAYLNLASAKRRATFVAISLIFPVLANIVRVYGIILIAYWTDMEHAAGADHLIYGWFFFAFVIVCLLGIGELMRTPVTDSTANSTQVDVAQTEIGKLAKPVLSQPVLIGVISSLVLGLLWLSAITRTSTALPAEQTIPLNELNDATCGVASWSPKVHQPDSQTHIYLLNADCTVQLYTAWFSETDNELVSDLHRVFDPEQYSLSHTTNISINGLTFPAYHVVSSNGKKLSIVRWYNVDNTVFTSSVKTKVHQLKNVLLGNASGGRMFVLAAVGHDAGELESAITVIVNGF